MSSITNFKKKKKKKQTSSCTLATEGTMTVLSLSVEGSLPTGRFLGSQVITETGGYPQGKVPTNDMWQWDQERFLVRKIPGVS